MKIDSFLAEQALLEKDWQQVASIMLGYFKLDPVPFEIRVEVGDLCTPCRAILVLAKEHKTYSFYTAEAGYDEAKFGSWSWEEPIDSECNYLLIL
jgi:hypothetical protein